MNLIDVLVWLGGAGVAAVSAFVLERLGSFQELSGNGKLIVAVSVAVVLGGLATAAKASFTANPDTLVAVEPYAQIVLSGVMIVVQQLVHGGTKQASANG